jgi:hypothetical protein
LLRCTSRLQLVVSLGQKGDLHVLVFACADR